MLRRPVTHYAVFDGTHIGYQVVGSGDLDVVLMHQWFTNIEAMWDVPLLASFVEEVSAFARVLLFDKRGTGVSDPGDPERDQYLKTFRSDLRSLLDVVGFNRPSFVVSDSATMLAIDFAAAHADRTGALVVIDGFAHRAGDTEGRIRSHIEHMRRMFNDGEGFDLLAPSFAGDLPFQATIARYFRLCASPGTAANIRRRLLEVDVRPLLPLVAAPTLVIHRTRNAFVSVELGRQIALGVPGAHLIELDGADQMMFVGNRQRISEELASFLTGGPKPTPRGRRLQTVVFTDIVGSTERAALLGDAQWAALLRDFRASARHLLARFEGREINTRGDDLLATFVDPAHAVDYALGLRDAISEGALQVRSGIHFGEVESVEGNDIGGIVVHIGARIAGAANPGEVLVSRMVADLLVGSAVKLTDRGQRKLKGVDGRWQLFEVSGCTQ
jgi:class 3 adenylate cyclase